MTTVFAAIISVINGIKWSDLENSIIKAINSINQPILIILVISMMMGAWLLSGIVPTMIYYGFKLISPSVFLPTACLLASITSLSTGDSWGTAGTVGLAIMAIGVGFGIPAPIVAGVVISGAYFGDKLSPVSDTTVLAAAVSDVDLFDHVKYMLLTTVPSITIAIIAYYFIGLKYSHNIDVTQINELLNVLKDSFNINPLLLLAPIAVMAMIALKVKPIPALMAGTILGAAFAMIFQGAILKDVLEVLHYGVELNTGNEMIDELISGGGMHFIMWTLSLIYCAMGLGGVLDGSGALEAVASKILARVRSTGDLIAATVVTAIMLNITAADQFMAIIFPGKMYKEEYIKRGINLKVLSRTVEDAGTVTSSLVPWATCGAFMTVTLGVHPLQYLPYAIFNWLCPILAIIYGYTNFKIAYTDKVEEEQAI